MTKQKKIIFSALALVLIGLIISGIIIARSIANPNNAFQELEQVTQPTIEPTEILSTQTIASPTPAPIITDQEILEKQTDKEFMQRRVNILLLGLDKSTERESWGSFRTDTMIVASINFDENKVYLLSIPRDSYVKIANRKTRDKINSAFGAGGGSDKNGYLNAMKTVSNLFGGVNIDYYMGFDMNVVKEIVNTIGGIDYYVDIPVKMNGRTLAVGQQKLDGQAVIDYSRVRKGSSDVARAGRQQQILVALFDQLKSTKQITKLPAIYSTVSKNLETNLNLAQISSIAYFATKINSTDIVKKTVEGEFLNMNNLSYWGISQNKLKKTVLEVFGKNISTDPQGDVYVIKRELEQKQAVISSAINSATINIKSAEQLILNNSQNSPQLNSLIGQLRALFQEGDADAILAVSSALQTEIQNSPSIISNITPEIPEQSPELQEQNQEIPEIPETQENQETQATQEIIVG